MNNELRKGLTTKQTIKKIKRLFPVIASHNPLKQN